MDIRTRVKIPTPTDPFLLWFRAMHVIAELRVVQSQLHETNKRNRAGRGDLRDNGSNEFRMPCAHGKLLFFTLPRPKKATPLAYGQHLPIAGCRRGCRVAFGSALSQGEIRGTGYEGIPPIGRPHSHSIVFVEYQPFGVAARSSLPAILTRSGREPAFIFCITLPRCALTVISLMPSSPPICLFYPIGGRL